MTLHKGLVVLVFLGTLHAFEEMPNTRFRDPGSASTPGRAEVSIRLVDPKEYSATPLDSVTVINPGSPTISIDEGISVADAIKAAGGLSRISSKHSISIITEGRGYAISFWGLEIESGEGIAFYSKIKLQRGDILVIAEKCLL